MGDINKPHVVNVIATHAGNSIVTSAAEKKEQVFRQPTTGTSYSLGQQINFFAEIEQSNRMLDNIGFRYSFNNTHATANLYAINGWWNLIDRLEIRINGGIVVDFPMGSVNLAALSKVNNYETYDAFIAERTGTYIQSVGVNEAFPSPSDFRLAVVNGTSLRFESYLSEIFKFMYKIHVKYIRNFQIILYLKSPVNIHKFLPFDAGFTSANFTITNVEMVLYFTNYRNGDLPVNIIPKLMYHEEFYEDRIFDVSAFAGNTTTVDIRLDTQYRAFQNIKKIFFWTDNTATNGTYDSTQSATVYEARDITSVEILHNGIRYQIFDSQRSLLIHQNKYHKRRCRRRIHSWLTFSELNQLPNSFYDCDRNDIVISNDGHHKVSMLNGISNQVSTNGEWRLRITLNAVAVRPNLHVCLEATHIICLFSDPNSTPYFQQ